MKKMLWISLFALLFFACSSGRRISHADLMKDAPDWAIQTPANSMYYHGVGMASKTTQQDYREKARQNALSELAGSISVNIASSSVLNQFEFDNSYSDFFRDNIRMSTQEFLEGYELVENWENDIQYWVYYRLSKSRYDQIKQERIRTALSQSVSKFQQAQTLRSQGRVTDALGFYIRSVEDIRHFLADELKAEINGQQKPWSTFLMAGLLDQLQAVQFDFQMDKFTLMPGPSTVVTPIEIIVKDHDGRPISGVPVITRYSWLPGNFTESVTDSRGYFRVVPQGIAPGKRSEQILCQLDLKKVTDNTTQDIMVQRLFSSLNTTIYTLPIEIIPPTCFIAVKAHSGDFDTSLISDEISRLFSIDGLDLSQDVTQSDYILDSDISLINQSKIGSRFTKTITATFVLKDHLGNIQYSAMAENITGLGQTHAEAWDDALKSLQGKIRINIYPAMINDAFLKVH